MYTLGELSEKLNLEFSGDGQCPITGIATLETAGPGDLAFLSNSKYLSQLEATGAGVVIVHPDHVQACPSHCLLSDNPYLTFARVSRLFDNAPKVPVGVHPAAVVDPEANISDGASIGPNAVVEAGTEIGAGVVIGANVYIGHGCKIGQGSRINPGAVLYHDVHIGELCKIHSQAVLGADGFGFAPGPDGWEKICQLGGVRIGNSVEIGACTSVDRGALDHTVIADGVILDNLVQIAHNCRVGKNTAIAGCAGLAGSAIIGANCTMAGGSGVTGHVEICDDVHIKAMTMVTKSITEPGSYSSGTQMMPTREWRRSAVRFAQLDAISRRLAAVEKQQNN